MFAIRLLSFFAGGEGFAADVALVYKIARKLDVTPVPAAPPEVAGIANIKGKVVTILNTAALLGRKRHQADGYVTRTVNALIFKPPSDGSGQMGLVMDRPGGLDVIDENETAAPDLTKDECLHTSGAYESGGVLYRIVDTDSIIGRFRNGGCTVSERQGGTVNEESA